MDGKVTYKIGGGRKWSPHNYGNKYYGEVRLDFALWKSAKPGEPHFSEVPHPRKEVERLLKGPLSDRHALVTLGMACGMLMSIAANRKLVPS